MDEDCLPRWEGQAKKHQHPEIYISDFTSQHTRPSRGRHAGYRARITTQCRPRTEGRGSFFKSMLKEESENPELARGNTLHTTKQTPPPNKTHPTNNKNKPNHPPKQKPQQALGLELVRKIVKGENVRGKLLLFLRPERAPHPNRYEETI